MKKTLLRKYVRCILAEVSKLPPSYFDTIDDAVLSSKFWEMPNDEDVSTSGHGQTAAAAKLQDSISKAFQELGLDIDVIVDSYVTSDEDYVLNPGHPAYPNRWLIDAKWYVSKNRPGRNTVDLMLMLSGDDFDMSDLNPSALVRHIVQSVRHELVHYSQMKKQSLKKGFYNDIEAFNDMLNDPSQIPNEDDPKYWEVYEKTGALDAEGKEIVNRENFDQKLYTQDYLRSHIEIDAHAHDTAEEMLAVYGHDKSMQALKQGFDLSDPLLPNAITHYYDYLSKDDPAIKKLKSKIYSYIKHFGER